MLGSIGSYKPGRKTVSKNEKPDKETLYCTFCSKSQHEVNTLVAGPACYICDECVELCFAIIEERNTLANRYMIGPAIDVDQLCELKESGFATADLLAGANIVCTDEATLTRPLDATLSMIGAAIKNRLAEFGGKESLRQRIDALEKHNRDETAKTSAVINRYRNDHELIIKHNEQSLDTLRRRLERLQSAGKIELT